MRHQGNTGGLGGTTSAATTLGGVVERCDILREGTFGFATHAFVCHLRSCLSRYAQSSKCGQSKLSFRLIFLHFSPLSKLTGAVQELIYNNLYTYLFGSATTALVVTKKVLFDAVFHNALVCIPMAYAVKAMVFGYSLRTAIKQYIDDVRHHGLLLKYYALWMPVNAMIFTIVPTHYRITVMACVSFFWMIILSTISSRTREA